MNSINFKHVTKEGHIWTLESMSDKHLRNSIFHFLKNAESDITVAQPLSLYVMEAILRKNKRDTIFFDRAIKAYLDSFSRDGEPLPNVYDGQTFEAPDYSGFNWEDIAGDIWWQNW